MHFNCIFLHAGACFFVPKNGSTFCSSDLCGVFNVYVPELTCKWWVMHISSLLFWPDYSIEIFNSFGVMQVGELLESLSSLNAFLF